MYLRILSPVFNRLEKLEENQNRQNKLLIDFWEYKNQKIQNRANVIYTCITGQYDDLQQHTFINYDYDYVCFTDNERLLKLEEYGIWKICHIKYTKLDSQKNSRWHKTHPHILFPEYNKSIWIDGNINIITGYLFDLIETESKYPIKIQVHPSRNCIYSEIEAVLECKKDIKEVTDKVMKLLKEDGFPEEYGLNDTSIIYREHNDKKIIEIMELWWDMIERYSRRDQLSLSYILWENVIKPSDIGIPNQRNTKNCKYYGHNK
jgi:hypothetical protein